MQEVLQARGMSGFGGEQFAVPEAVASLRESRLHMSDEAIALKASETLNLVGVVVPGERPAAVPGKTVSFAGGAVRMQDPLAVTAV